MSIRNTAAASLLVDVVRDLAVQGWKLATGQDGAKKSLESVVEKAVDAAIDTVRAELWREITALGLAYDITVLADAPRDVLDALTPHEPGIVARVLDGIEIRELGPDEALDDTAEFKKVDP